MENWKKKLKEIASDVANTTERQGLYLNTPTGAIINVKNIDRGGLAIEAVIPQSGLSKIFMINRTRENLALIVRLNGDEPIDRLMCVGTRAFLELKTMMDGSSIIKEPDARLEAEKNDPRPFFYDKVNGL
ncbi:MAG: hypothetical protein PHG66_06570 [Candidatus Colwellbacteria bacterium]|nr:hypothetical protein [Candidatus Colwellbacteria bacterium]